MGDTFTDNWDAPEEFGKWRLFDRDITKYSGNKYRYELIDPSVVPYTHDCYYYIEFRSLSSSEIELDGRVCYNNGNGVTLEIAKFSGDFIDGSDNHYTPGTYWNNIETALTALDAKFWELHEIAQKINILGDHEWEGCS